MQGMRIAVESYNGYRAGERPLRFTLGGKCLEVEEILDRWYSPGALFFRVRVADGSLYVLRHDEDPGTAGNWTLEAFRRGPRPDQTSE